jgi:tetratricopeptide (TPR) repeat protein
MIQHVMPATRFFLLLIISAMCSVSAAPFVPTNDGQIIERLPQKNDSAGRELKTLRATLNQSPGDLHTALIAAQRYIELGRAESDPRYYGYAQAALANWWNLPQPPAEVLVLRATIAQSTHHFDAALADLDTVLQRDRNNGQARLTRATILQVQGRYDEARQNCAALLKLADELVTQTCLATVAGLNGQARTSYTSLTRALEKNPAVEPAIKIWTLTALAEMAQRLGENSEAEKHFRTALAMDGDDSYLLGAYADFLLDRQRPQEVDALLKNKTRIDPLLLRYVLALQVNRRGDLPQHIDTLRDRFAAATLRGDSVHRREESRFTLHVLHEPKRALALAKQNWQVQKEPADARVLAEAALAANDGAALDPLREWLSASRLQDVQLDRLLGTAMAKNDGRAGG